MKPPEDIAQTSQEKIVLNNNLRYCYEILPELIFGTNASTVNSTISLFIGFQAIVNTNTTPYSYYYYCNSAFDTCTGHELFYDEIMLDPKY